MSSGAVAEPDAAAGVLPEPAKKFDRELEATSRSARYALVAAVSAAVISSFVSAGAAVYVNVNQADRTDQQAVANAARTDREKIYADFSGALVNYVGQLGIIRGRLMAHQPADSLRSDTAELSRTFAELGRQANMLVMAGSPGMGDVALRIIGAHSTFWIDRAQPFIDRYLQLPDAPGANDHAGWQKDSAGLSSAISDLLNKLGDLNDAFVRQGTKDLQFPH